MVASSTAAQIVWGRKYETVYILRPSTDAETSAQVVERIKGVIDRRGGKLLKINNWGKRTLAYSIADSSRGIYVQFVYAGFGDLVAEVERNLSIVDAVIRQQTVVIERDLDMNTVTVDEAELQFEHVDEVDEEPVYDRARELGLDGEDRPMRSRRHEEEFADDDGDGDGGGNYEGEEDSE